MVEAVCPTVYIMGYDMLTYPRPLCVILRRIYVISLYLSLVFNCNSKSVIRLNSCFNKRVYYGIGKGEIVRFGIVFVCIKVSKNIGDINKNTASKKPPYVVKSGVWRLNV